MHSTYAHLDLASSQLVQIKLPQRVSLPRMNYHPAIHCKFMDIVTHAMIGIVGASPAIATYPIGAMAFAIGSVAPDLDALSRLFGKKAFLNWHQTYSHSIPIIAVLSALIAASYWFWVEAAFELSIGFGLGMTVHSLMDVSNTFGIKLMAPFSQRRFSSEWVFFIDLPVILTTSFMLTIVLWQFQNNFDSIRLFWTGVSFWIFVAAYWSGKGFLKTRALKNCAANSCLIPCAFLPWRFLGCTQVSKRMVETYSINSVSGKKSDVENTEVFSSSYSPILLNLAEFAIMRKLSPMFHVVEVQTSDNGTALKCRDLRTRNFNTKFGELIVKLGNDGHVKELKWNV